MNLFLGTECDQVKISGRMNNSGKCQTIPVSEQMDEIKLVHDIYLDIKTRYKDM